MIQKHLAIYLVNTFVVVTIFLFEKNSSSDKTIIIASFLYLILLVMNLVAAMLSRFSESQSTRHFMIASLLLTILPLVYGLIWV